MSGPMKLSLLLVLYGTCTALAAIVPGEGHALRVPLDPHTQALSFVHAGQPPQSQAELQEQEITWFRAVAELVLMLLVGGVIGAVVGGGVLCVMSRRKSKDEDTAEQEASEGAPSSAAPRAAPKQSAGKPGRECMGVPLMGADGGAALQSAQLMEGLQAFSARLQPEIPRLKKLAAERAAEVGDNAKAFVCSELEDTAKILRKALNECEAELTLEWNTAVEANLPPMSVILAGSLSPMILSASLLSHALQFFLLFLPVACLSVLAMYMDADEKICVIPSLTTWLWVGGGLAILLALSHGSMMIRISAGQKALAKKAAELDHALEPNDDHPHREPSTREVFMRASVLLQTSAHLQHEVQTSIWYTICGACTFFWLPVMTWVTFLVVIWTFYPGTVAFHPAVAASGVANAELCEAVYTVFVARIAVLLSSLFWIVHMMQVFGWILETTVHSKALSQKILKGARDIDDSLPLGFPYAEIIVRAFVLHGDKDYLRSRLSVASAEQMILEAERQELRQQADELKSKAEDKKRHLAALEKTAEERGGTDHAAQVSHLEAKGVAGLQGWKEQGRIMINKADEDAAAYRKALAERSSDEESELQEMVSNINSLMAQVQEQVGAMQANQRGQPALPSSGSA